LRATEGLIYLNKSHFGVRVLRKNRLLPLKSAYAKGEGGADDDGGLKMEDGDEAGSAERGNAKSQSRRGAKVFAHGQLCTPPVSDGEDGGLPPKR